ncbi:hypothetical protein PPRY_a0430 [Pseudoalteromonas prydzensis ACAM 620]|nr:hypothetical protein [Pseudoalteromonas prydzensis ACAM 620]
MLKYTQLTYTYQATLLSIVTMSRYKTCDQFVGAGLPRAIKIFSQRGYEALRF